MAEAKFVVVMSICIFLAAGCIGAGMLLGQKEIEVALKAEKIVVMETQKSTLETKIEGLLSEKSLLELEVSGLEDETTELSGEVTVLEDEVTVLEGEVSSLQTEVSDLETQVTESYNQGYSEGEDAGFDEGYAEGVDYVMESGFYLRDPTYAEAVEFIESDLTDRHAYTADYVCYDFTADFNANAEDQGYRCGFVYMTFNRGAHAIACFNTVDEGLIYIEPQTDEIVSPQIGQIYNGELVESLGIIW